MEDKRFSFDIKISEKDLFYYNIYTAYTSMQGIFSILVFLFLIAVWIMQFQNLTLVYKIIYPLVGVVFVAYLPIELKVKVKQRFLQGTYDAPLHYSFGSDGIVVRIDGVDEVGELPWDYVYKVSRKRDLLLIYTNRKNAYIIPVEQLQPEYAELMNYIKQNVKDSAFTVK